MESFMPWHGLAGGMLIGLAAGFYLLVNGRTAGISGIVEQAMQPGNRGFVQSLAFVIGLPLGAVLVWLVAPGIVPRVEIGGGIGMILVAGFLVGFGARVAGGCTSGHGVCGLPRFSIRSIIATLTFMGVAALTVFVVRHVI
jgi:uncharacterized membrane protein YedE/YeeE